MLAYSLGERPFDNYWYKHFFQKGGGEMNSGLSFCQNTNQSLQVHGIMVGKEKPEDVELNQAVVRLKMVGILPPDASFANRAKCGEFLLSEKKKFKEGISALNREQEQVLNQGLRDIIGNSLYS